MTASKSLTLEWLTFRFATLVVDVTVIGAVPVATLETTVDAVIDPMEFKLATLAFPDKVKILLVKSYTRLESPDSIPELLY